MYKLIIKGIVQGVGFRPYIYKRAIELGLFGTVRNIGDGVEIIINEKDFIKKLNDLPPLARIDEYIQTKIESNENYSNFSILKSENTNNSNETIIPADIYMCEDCKKELLDKNNRRYKYYFITCTNCGPRFSLIEDYPYDRPLTSMKIFEMCENCKKEYDDPNNRRYHAQTIACKNCGPKLKLIIDNKNLTQDTDENTIKKACELLKNKELIAIKGVGGFHLCSLTNGISLQKLRTKLGRENKPFALMVKDLDMAKKITKINSKEEELLLSHQRPIVVLEKIDNNAFRDVSELNSIGLMLPYTSLHYLLFEFIDEPIVMTSCNLPGNPVSIKEQIGENFLTHEREIINRCDDSVLKVIDNNVVYLRRSRGFAPQPIQLFNDYNDTLALGTEINNVICVGKKDKAYLSQYIGETSKFDTFEFLKESVSNMIKLTRLKPKLIVCDLHPEYNSTQYAKEISTKYEAKLIQIQHHKAHVASVACEYNLKDYIGIAMDGTGFGEDEVVWGGEIFDVNDEINFKRIGHLEEQPQLGGDSATINPKKMLFGILSKFMNEKELITMKLFDENELKLYLNQLKENFNVLKTTSTGRILDAVSALLNICDKRTYDGRPAMILESFADNNIPFNFDPVIIKKDDKCILLTTPLLEFLIKNLDKDKQRLAATAQMYIAKGMYKIANEYLKNEGRNKKIVFSGGVAYNKMITSYMINNNVLINKEIPCGDGGVCYGQVYLADAIIRNK